MLSALVLVCNTILLVVNISIYAAISRENRKPVEIVHSYIDEDGNNINHNNHNN